MNEILHFGPGNFFRAHLADYTQDAGGWRITGVSLRSSGIRDGLAAQNYEYTLAASAQSPKKINVLADIIVAPESPQSVLQLVSDERFSILSATVTEKGYTLDPSGALDLKHPDVVHDLMSTYPRSFVGIVARGLAQRKSPLTVLSCDNRLGNGDALARAVREFQAASGLDISCDVSFPNSMVDRITPATTDAERERFGDPMVVTCEAFKEWVIEDNFVTSRPDWPGAQWVADVKPHEMRKLRMLNGAHSYLAYAGLLSGHTYVHEAIADPVLRSGALGLMTEAAMSLPTSMHGPAQHYASKLITRFDNEDVNHALRQIAMDGSEKVPYRLLDTIRANLGSGDEVGSLAQAVRAWIDFVVRETANGTPLQDPRSADLAIAAKADDPVLAILSLVGAGDLAEVISG